MGTYIHTFSAQRRKVEFGSHGVKRTLNLMPYAYKNTHCWDETEEKWRDRKHTSADRAADKAKEEGRADLVILRDSWDKVEMGDTVYKFGGSSHCDANEHHLEAFGFIVGRKGNGQFIVGMKWMSQEYETTTITEGNMWDRVIRYKYSIRRWDEVVRTPKSVEDYKDSCYSKEEIERIVERHNSFLCVHEEEIVDSSVVHKV
jgi:hypothetical protein